MDFIDKIRDLANRVSRQLDYIQTEEATKNALVMPFFGALGYNVFDPTEFTPELNADIGVKKGEKVDYAILQDGKPVILVECKHHATDLSQVHASQLYRYFSVTEARFSILTNGLVYWFYTDLEAPNKMDAKPFFEFSLLDIREPAVEELKKFSKSSFDLENILATASELKYTREIKRILLGQMQEPSEEFIKFVASQVYTGRLTTPIKEQFGQLIRQAFKLIVSDRINERLQTALVVEKASQSAPPEVAVVEETPIVATTEEEYEAFHIVRAILRLEIDVHRITLRDVQSYCGILLDDNNRKPICRLHFNRIQKYLGLFDGTKEEKIPIESVDGIYQYAERLRNTVVRYEQQ